MAPKMQDDINVVKQYTKYNGLIINLLSKMYLNPHPFSISLTGKSDNTRRWLAMTYIGNDMNNLISLASRNPGETTARAPVQNPEAMTILANNPTVCLLRDSAARMPE